jgi:tetratricopeptide (TPR) repeat protein
MDNIIFSISSTKQSGFIIKALKYCHIFSLIIFCSFNPSSAIAKEIAPERDISVVREAPYSPDWKILWDGARNLVRNGQFALAADAYAQLFSIKPNIEEANWEYCKVLMEIQSYQTAAKIISLLLESNPGRIDYLLEAGEVAFQQKKYAEAERYFGRIFEKSPTGEYGDAALKGLAYSLRLRGQNELAFPLMQQLVLRFPENKIYLHDYASDAASLQRLDLSRMLYGKLLAEEVLDGQILFEAASVFDAPGFETERNTILKRYLKLYPDYLPFRMSLLEAYQKNDNYSGVMEQLSYIIDHFDDVDELLLTAAEIAQKQLNRPDKALSYLDKYQALHPENTEITTTINQLQLQLAKDLMSIVENNGVDLLWDDLAAIRANRVAIFQHMSVLLEDQKKIQALIAVLEVLHDHKVDTDVTSLRLAKLFHLVKNYHRSGMYVVQVPMKLRDVDYYLLKADNEKQLAQEQDSLQSLTKAFELAPKRIDIGLQCLELSGQLGLVEQQVKFFKVLERQSRKPIAIATVKAHIVLLAQNGLFEEALAICEKSLERFGSSTAESLQIFLLKVDLLRKSGRARLAEQILRQLLFKNEYARTVLLQLISNALSDKDVAMARKWFELLSPSVRDVQVLPSAMSLLEKEYLVHIRLLRLDGDTDGAAELLEKVEQKQNTASKVQVSTTFAVQLMKEKCLLYLATEDYLGGEKFVSSNIDKYPFDPELFVLYERLLSKNTKEKKDIEYLLSQGDHFYLTRLLRVIDYEIDYHLPDKARKHLEVAQQKLQNSSGLKLLAVKLDTTTGTFERANNTLAALYEENSNEPSLCKKQVENEAKAGHYSVALDKYGQCFATSGKEPGNLEGDEQVDQGVLYARLLWGAKKYEESLAVYKKLIDPPIDKILIRQFRERKIDYQYLTRDQTLWNSIMVMLESDPEIIAEFMEPKFLFENMGTDTGEIVANNFEKYSWQTIIENEFSARKAIFNKNYHFAAKSYEKLLEKEESKESKVDLATIYGKIGKYRKEAQVYEDITSVGEVTPELEESIQQNFLQLRPTNTLDAVLFEKDGRNGNVDIRKTSLGSTFWITPELNKDFWVSYAYNKYESADRKDYLGSNILQGAMTYEFAGGYELITGLGTEKINASSENEVQYNLELKGQLDDYVSGFVLFKKEPIDDTVDAMENGINRQYVQTGLTVETELGVTFGGDLRYSLYSDDNEQKRFYWFSSYSIFGESLQLDVRYAYQYMINKDVNGPDALASEVEDEDYVTDYWSPDNYTEHRLALEFKKDFFGYLTDMENKMSYFKFDAGVSLEDQENVAYSSRFDIFLEMSPHLLLKGNFSFTSSDVYDDKMLSLSLHYSW